MVSRSAHSPLKPSVLKDLHLGPVLCLTLIFWINFIARVILSPLMPTIEKDLGITHTEAGSLFLFISVGYFSGLLSSGFISVRLTHRKAIIISAAVVGLSLAGTALSNGFRAMGVGLFCMGFGSGIYLPSGIAAVTALVEARHWGKALAIHELAPILAFVAAPLISEALLTAISWRGVLSVLGIASLAAGLTFALWGRGGRFPGEPPRVGSAKMLFSEPSFWIMVVLFSLGVSSTLGIYTMLPLYLVVEHGVERNLANTLVSVSRLPGIAMVFLAGMARDRFGSKRTLSLVFLIGGSITVLLGLLPRAGVLILIFFQPWIAGCFFPAGFAALSSIGPPRVRNVAVSLTLPFSILMGAGAVPTWIGFTGDAGSFGFGIAVLGGCILCGVLLTRFLNIEGEAGG